MTAVVTHLYDNEVHARAAVERVRGTGIREDDISIVSNTGSGQHSRGDMIIDRDRDGTDDRTEAAQTGAGVGAGIGGLAGLLAGIGIMAVPGIGPVVAAGWLASTALGAAVGGASGGIIGALTQAGVSDDDANVYAEGVRRGGTLVSVRVAEQDRTRVQQLLSDSAVDIERRRRDYQTAGWSRFDSNAGNTTGDGLQRGRERAP